MILIGVRKGRVRVVKKHLIPHNPKHHEGNDDIIDLRLQSTLQLLVPCSQAPRGERISVKAITSLIGELDTDLVAEAILFQGFNEVRSDVAEPLHVVEDISRILAAHLLAHVVTSNKRSTSSRTSYAVDDGSTMVSASFAFSLPLHIELNDAQHCVA